MEHGLYLGTRSRTRPDTRKAMVGALKAGLIVMAVFADRIAPYSYDESVPGSRKKPPSVRFMGTDNIGRDMWSRAVRHARRLSTAGRRQDRHPALESAPAVPVADGTSESAALPALRPAIAPALLLRCPRTSRRPRPAPLHAAC